MQARLRDARDIRRLKIKLIFSGSRSKQFDSALFDGIETASLSASASRLLLEFDPTIKIIPIEILTWNLLVAGANYCNSMSLSLVVEANSSATLSLY